MKIEASVVDVDYRTYESGESEGVELRLFAKSSKGENILAVERGFDPYFYALVDEGFTAEDVKDRIVSEEFQDDNGDSLNPVDVETVERKKGTEPVKAVKVYTAVPASVPKLKHEVYDLEEVSGCREFDIPFYKRYLIDKQILPTQTVELKGEELKSEDFDVKIDVEDTNTDLELAEPDFTSVSFDLEVIDDKVVMASFYGENIKKVISTKDVDKDFVESVDSEKVLLDRLIELVQELDVDVLTGYNTDEFDFQILRERVEEHGMELSLGRDGERMKFNRRGRFSGARLKGRMHLDLYPFVEHVVSPGLESERLDLDSVSEEMLGENKDDVSFEEMKKWWRNEENLEELASYALKDSKLAFKLSNEMVPQILELSKITGLIPFDACRLTYGQLTENFLLKEAAKKNMLSPNRPTRNTQRRRQNQGAYEGGFVYTPESGLYDDISVFDFRSLYPTVMVAHNISPETLNLEDCDETFRPEGFDFSFCQDSQGFFPELIQGLVESRYELKDEMKKLDKDSMEYERIYSRQQAQKVLANSFYGYLGYNGARWYSKECAQATTFMGRKYIEDTIETAREMGFEINYGDTDSVFLSGDDIEGRKDEFLRKVNSDLPEFMELEFEGFFKTGFFTSKDSGEGAKKKYALMDDEGDMKITGFEQVRRDWSSVAKDTQRRVLQKVLNRKVEEAAEIVKETIKSLKNQEVDVEKLRIFTTLTKPPEEYESTSPHVEAAKKAIERGKEIEPEATIGYVITRGSGNISARAETAEFADSYDPDYYIDNQVIPAAVRVLKVFGYTEAQLKGKGKQSGLDRFG